MGIFYPYIAARGRAPDRRRGGGRGHRHRPARGVADRRAPGRAARQPHLPAAGRGRPDHRDALDLRRPRLSRRRPRARVAQGQRPRRVRRRSPTTRRSPRSTSCCRTEGIIPALESRHALAYAAKLAPTLPRDRILLVNLSGRGDKDMNTVAERSGLKFYCRPECDPRGAARTNDEPHRRHASRALRAAGRTALIPYVTAGDPAPAATRADHARAGRGRRRHRSSSACRSPIRWPTAR